MSLRERVSAAWRAFRNEQELGGLYGEEAERLLEWLGVDRENKKAISEVTYYTCLKVLAETIGKMPLKYYQMTEEGRIRAAPDKTTELLTVRPNPIMTPTSMMTTLEMNTQHYGNGYLWLRRVFYRSRYGGLYKLLDIWPMQSDCVRVYMDDMGVFMRNHAGTANIIRKGDITEQMRSEVMAAFQNILNEMGNSNHRVPVLELPSYTDEIKKTMDEKVFDEPIRARGVRLVSFTIESVSLDDASQKKIDRYEYSTNSMMQQGKIIDVMETAAGNENGAVGGFMGVGMANMGSGGMTGSAMQNAWNGQGGQTTYDPYNQQPKAQSQGVACPNCGTMITGKFCPECGTPAPTPKTTMKCPKCGTESTGKFCPECGTPLAAVGPKKCPKCGTEVTGKFCPECGTPV